MEEEKPFKIPTELIQHVKMPTDLAQQVKMSADLAQQGKLSAGKFIKTNKNLGRPVVVWLFLTQLDAFIHFSAILS